MCAAKQNSLCVYIKQLIKQTRDGKGCNLQDVHSVFRKCVHILILFHQVNWPFEVIFVSKSNVNVSAIPKMAVFPGALERSRTLRVRCDAAVTWGFPELSAGLPRPSLLFDGRRKKRLRLWREGRKKGGTTVGTTRKDFSVRRAGICEERRERQQLVVFFGGVNAAFVSVPLCRCVSPLVGQKNWVRGVPLLGSELLNLSAWAERGETRFWCFQSM